MEGAPPGDRLLPGPGAAGDAARASEGREAHLGGHKQWPANGRAGQRSDLNGVYAAGASGPIVRVPRPLRAFRSNSPKISAAFRLSDTLVASPSPSTVANSRRFSSSTRLIRSSIVSLEMNLVTMTWLFWPMRWARLIAWSSTAGFHQRSNRNTYPANCRLSPTAPVA